MDGRDGVVSVCVSRPGDCLRSLRISGGYRWWLSGGHRLGFLAGYKIYTSYLVYTCVFVEGRIPPVHDSPYRVVGPKGVGEGEKRERGETMLGYKLSASDSTDSIAYRPLGSPEEVFRVLCRQTIL